MLGLILSVYHARIGVSSSGENCCEANNRLHEDGKRDAITMHDKIAICILAHTDPVHLSRLVKSFDFPFFDIFIHLDGKVGLESFSDVGKNCSQSEVKFIQRREICSWGGVLPCAG